MNSNRTATRLAETDIHSSRAFVSSTQRPVGIDVASVWPFNATGEFYAHALMAGAQASMACNELSELMETHGEHASAVLLRQLAVAEDERAGELLRKVAGRPFPQMVTRWRDNWLYDAPPDASARELVAHLLTPHTALGIVLNAVNQLLARYKDLSTAADDAEVRAEARELASEKSRQVQNILNVLASMPPPFIWSEDFVELYQTT